MVELKIDKEFKEKIPPLTDAEFEQLRENILSDGEVYEPIVTWNGAPDSVSSTIIGAVARFIKTYDGKFDEKKLIQRLSKRAPVEIIRNGRASLCKGDAKWAREILAAYNNGTSVNRLPDLFM